MDPAEYRVTSLGDVPAYLRDGELYRTLLANPPTDATERFSVPKGCMKTDPWVKNSQDVSELLTTLRFWVVSDLPNQFYNFAFSSCVSFKDIVGFSDAVEPFVPQFPQLRSLVTVRNAETRDQQLTTAALCNDVRLLSYLFEETERPWTHDECVTAAAYGCLEALTYAHMHGCAWFNPTAKKVLLPTSTKNHKWIRPCACYAALSHSHLQCYRYARDHGCICDYDCRAGLCENWTPDCLEYVVREDILCDTATSPTSVAGSTSSVKINVKQAKEWAQSALDTSSLPILEILHKLGWHARQPYVHYVVFHKPAAMLSALVRHGCELIGCELTHLVDLGRLDELQPLFDRSQVLGGVDIQTMLQLPNGRPAVEHAITHRYCSACDGALIALLGAVGQPVAYDLLELALNHGFPRATALCEVAAQEGDLELLMFAHKHGCPLTLEVYRLAAQEGNLSCLQYLVGTGAVPLSASMATAAMCAGRVDCLMYLLDQGCPAQDLARLVLEALVEALIDDAGPQA
jgi:hypothetical protein